MSDSRPDPPPRRADAARNRERILDAARAAFADANADPSMAEISRRAGVGMATLYRNFPGRRELLAALYLGEVDAVCEAAAKVAGDTPAARLEAWLERFYDYFTSKRAVAAELLTHTGSDDPVFAGGRPRVVAAGEPLLRAAQESGEVRRDLSLDQILDLIVAVAKIPGERDYLAPILRATLDGLRASSPGPA